eukprot:PhF_6_TR40683/c0_g1_i4/m.61136
MTIGWSDSTGDGRNYKMCEHLAYTRDVIIPLIKVSPGVLDPRFDRCYCSTCEPQGPRRRRDGHGSIPFGYSRIALHMEPGIANARGVFSWPKAFHGTKAEFVNSIVQLGHLVCPGDTLPTGVTLQIRDGHIKRDGIRREVTLDNVREGRAGITSEITIHGSTMSSTFNPTQCVFVSPTHVYAECPVYTTPMTVDKTVKVTFLLEFRFESGSFDVGPHTVGPDLLRKLTAATTEHCPDPHTWEWYTNRYGSSVLTGILVRVHNKTFGVKSVPPAPLPSAEDALKFFAHSVPNDKFLKCGTAFERLLVMHGSGVNPLYFNHEFDLCYCSTCQPNGDKPYMRAGRTYMLPAGYTRVAVRLDEKRASAERVWDTWPVCYHGTTLAAVPRILKTGRLLPTGCYDCEGDVVAGRDNITMREGRTATAGRNQGKIYFTPVLAYAAHPVHATWTKVRLPGGKVMEVSVVLQLRARPGFETGEGTLAGFETPRSEMEYSNQLEWSTNRLGSVVINGILLRTRPVT